MRSCRAFVTIVILDGVVTWLQYDPGAHAEVSPHYAGQPHSIHPHGLPAAVFGATGWAWSSTVDGVPALTDMGLGQYQKLIVVMLS